MVQIEELEARLADDVALANLLASIPLPRSVRPLLRRSFFGRKWNPVHQIDHWFGSNGTTVVCVKISGATAAATARMRMRFDDLRSASPGLQPSRKILHSLIEAIAREDADAVAASVLQDRRR